MSESNAILNKDSAINGFAMPERAFLDRVFGGGRTDPYPIKTGPSTLTKIYAILPGNDGEGINGRKFDPHTELVLKQYDPEGHKFLLAEGDPVPETLEGWRKIIEERNVTTKEFYSGTLPDFVVPTETIVAPTEAGERVHDVQEKIEFVDSLLGLCDKDNPLEILKSKGLSPEQIAKLAEEIQRFVDQSRKIFDVETGEKFPILKERVFDLFAVENVVITKDGHIRTFDTNTLYKADQDSPFIFLYENTISNIETLAQKLQKTSIAEVA